MNKLNLALSQSLKEFRESLNITQEDLAFRANVHRTYISQLERGLKQPSLKIVFQICDALEIDPQTFIAKVWDKYKSE